MMHRSGWMMAAALAAGGLLAGCLDDSTADCTAGHSLQCVGEDGCTGLRQCNPDTGTWGACQCVPPDDAIQPADTATTDADAVEPDAEVPAGDATEAGTDAEDADSTDIEVQPPYEEPAVRVLYDLFATPVDGFFPWDRHLAADGGILVDNGDYSCASLPYLADGPYPPLMQQVHGFASYGPLVFQASVPLDTASLPADLAGSTADDASIRLYELDDSGHLAARAAFLVQYFAYPADEYWIVRLLPAWPLTARRYLVVVTDALRGEDGTPVARSRGFAQVTGQAAVPADAPQARRAQVQAEADTILPLMALLPDPDHVVAAATFRTAWNWHDADELVDLFHRFQPPSVPPVIGYDADLDDDGTPDIRRDGDLGGCGMDAAEMGWALKGRFNPLNLTDPDTGHWVKDGDGNWTEFPPQDVEFNLMVPAGAGPFPLVVAQHGIASSQSGMCAFARRLVRNGIAVLRFDFPRHGSRGTGGDAYNWGLDFLSIGDPIRVRENFRQAALDIASSLVLADEIVADATLWQQGDPVIDTTRIGFAGHSLGSIIGMVYLPFSTRVGAFVSNVGGVGMFHLVEQYVQRTFGDVFDAQGYVNAAEQIVWAGDAVAYADRLLKGFYRPDGDPAHLLAQEVIDDDTVANATTEMLARSAGLSLVGTVQRPIPGVDTVDPATVESGLMQFAGVSHGDFTDSDDPPSEFERVQAVHFLKSWFDTGHAEIIVEPVPE